MDYDGTELLSLQPEQAQAEREIYLRTVLIPLLNKKVFEQGVESVTLFVAQYWDDEANDAVHPVFATCDRVACPKLVDGTRRRFLKEDKRQALIEIFREYDLGWQECSWDSNGRAITLWAAWCKEGGSQENDCDDDSYSPAVTIARDGTLTWYPQLRPYIDGISTEWERNDLWTVEESKKK